MSGRKVALIAALLIVALAAFSWWLFNDSGDVPAEQDGAPRTGALVKPGTTQEPAAPELTSTEKERIPAAEHTEQARTLEDEVKEEDAARKVNLFGTIIAIDEAGMEHTGEDGTFYFTLWTGSSGDGLEVEVVDGRWSADVPPDVILEIDDVLLDDRVAFLEELRDVRFPVPEQGRMDLRAKWIRPNILHVKAEDTGKELDRIELVCPDDADHTWTHPGNYGSDEVLLTSARSPIDLSAFQDPDYPWGAIICFARSPGYAWGSIHIDPELGGGERFLMLKRCGTVEVTLSNHDPESHASLRFRRIDTEDNSPMLDIKLGKDPVLTIDSLAEGRYQAGVEIGEWWRDPMVLGTGEVEILPGRLSQLTLMLQEAPKADTVPLRGTVVMQKAWGVEAFGLSAKLLDTPLGGNPGRVYIPHRDLELLEGSMDTFAWDAGKVQAGRYELTIRSFEPDFAYAAPLLVPMEGLTDARVEVPTPEKVTLRVLDATSGGDADVHKLTWHSRLSQQVAGNDSQYVHQDDHVAGIDFTAIIRDKDTGCFEFLAPRGVIQVAISDEAYKYLTRYLEIQSGLNVLTIEVEQACGITVVLKDGETLVPCEDLVGEVIAEEVGGKGCVLGWEEKSAGLFIKLNKPGLYRLTFPEMKGFLPVPAQEVQVGPGEIKEVIIPLTRK